MVDRVTVAPADDGVAIRLRVKPGGRRDRLIGAHGGALKLEVAAAPDRGRANRAVIKLLARTFGLTSSAVEITFGGSSQDKRVVLHGLDTSAAIRVLATSGVPAVADAPDLLT